MTKTLVDHNTQACAFQHPACIGRCHVVATGAGKRSGLNWSGATRRSETGQSDRNFVRRELHGIYCSRLYSTYRGPQQ